MQDTRLVAPALDAGRAPVAKTAVALIVAAVALLGANRAWAGVVPQLVRIADTGTPLPGGSGGLFNDFEAPVIEDSVVVFWSWDGNLEEGVYYGNDVASLQALVDRNTQIPGRPETFGIIAGVNNAGGPVIEGRQVVFRAQSNILIGNQNFLATGFYVGSLFANDVQVVVESSFDPPAGLPPPLDGVVAFVDFFNPSFENDVVAYRGDTVDGGGNRRASLFRTVSGQMPELVFHAGDPASNDFSGSLNVPWLTDGDTLFSVFSLLLGGPPRMWGVYRESGGTIAPVVEGSDNPPPAPDNFTRIGGGTNALLGRPIGDGNRVLFYAERADGDPPGLFYKDGATAPQVVAAVGGLGTPIPDGTGTFTSIAFDNWAIEGGRVLFVGRGSNGQVGIYEWVPGGTPVEWLSSNSIGDLEPGRPASTLVGIRMAAGGLDDGLVAFTAFFDDGSAAIYRSGGPAGSAPTTPILPFTTGVPGRFDFPRAQVVRDALVFYDPEVAVGYEFEVVSGPGVSQLALPPEIGDGVYEIRNFEDPVFVPVGSTFEDGDFAVFDFGEPATRFRIVGIEPSAGLDPDDPLAFPAGLAFAEDGEVEVSMTVLVPEPGAGAAALAAILGLMAMRKRRDPSGRTRWRRDARTHQAQAPGAP